MLDRTQRNQYHYYQPGIGTYISDSNLSDTGCLSKLKSSYLKAKDTAVGSSFADHVLGGYQFLMRYYSPGDDIYFFGFSRGSYIARFLAEMLDYVGLLSAGNEELVQFAWNTFAKWQQRSGETAEDRRKKKKVFKYMKAFRETFSRPVKRIRFLGMFDTVNSVPRFESAWMKRNKFPYTARSSAKVIRHAVAIDERRAKFRQDLISEARPYKQPAGTGHIHLPRFHHAWRRRKDGRKPKPKPNMAVPEITINDGPANEKSKPMSINDRTGTDHTQSTMWGEEDARYRIQTPYHMNLAVPQQGRAAHDDASSGHFPSHSSIHMQQSVQALSLYSDDDAPDIEEVWFPGCHADIGGGWHLVEGETWPLSHAPLVWMVQEAQRAGLHFDERKLKEFECLEEVGGHDMYGMGSSFFGQSGDLAPPEHPSADEITGVDSENLQRQQRQPQEQSASSLSFHSALHLSSTSGHIHDCLEFDAGISTFSVMLWRVIEYLPFRRMDLQPDGSWKPIRWPLPCGEVRDIPDDAHIHSSAIKRLLTDTNYRPGNLILGGGGRGTKRAPEDAGVGEWVVVKGEGHPVQETYIRKRAWEKKRSGIGENGPNGKNGQKGSGGANE